MTYIELWQISTCAQKSSCLKSKYPSYVSAWRVSRYVGRDVRYVVVFPAGNRSRTLCSSRTVPLAQLANIIRSSAAKLTTTPLPSERLKPPNPHGITSLSPYIVNVIALFESSGWSGNRRLFGPKSPQALF